MRYINQWAILILFFLPPFVVSAQLPEPTQEFRGLWVTQFKTTVLGNVAAEDALIAYALDNDFNYLICTNMFQILTASCGSFTPDMIALQTFVAKAHAEGIEYVSGNVGSLATAEKIQDYNNCGSVTSAQKLDMITYECEFYNAATNGSCPSYDSYISQLTAIKSICSSTTSSVMGRPLVCEAYIGGEGSTGLVLTYSSEAEMEEIATVADHILITYYRPMPSSSGGNFFNWTIGRLDWIAKTGTPSNIVLLLKSRNTDSNNMNAYLASYPGTHYDAVRDPFLSWVEGMDYNPALTKGYREKYDDGTYPWLDGIQVKGFTWFEHAANMALAPLPISLISFDITKIQNKQVLLKWATASEVNNDYFEIQNSADGQQWHFVSKISGNGTTTTYQYYSFTDQKPLSGTSYYRIKQVDFDGQVSYTPIKSISVDRLNNDRFLGIFPNPVDHHLSIVGAYSDDVQIQIFDILGREMNSFSTEKVSSTISLDVSIYPLECI
ncbi:MAG: hypothetical protein R2795_02725 [Saprospiraceae bacterium]